MSDIAVLENERVLDLRGLSSGRKPLVFDGESWVPFRGSAEAVIKSRPVSEPEARALIGGVPLAQYDSNSERDFARSQ